MDSFPGTADLCPVCHNPKPADGCDNLDPRCIADRWKTRLTKIGSITVRRPERFNRIRPKEPRPLNITIRTIPHAEQRYPTVGDWWFDDDGPSLHIRVSALGDEKMEACIAIHELTEVLLCKARGITQERVDAFDKQYEWERDHGHHSEDEEPGDSLDAPYYHEHQVATVIERLLAHELGVDWTSYEKAILALF